jgi:uncharacterized repeat protein (TIGR03803 family)
VHTDAGPRYLYSFKGAPDGAIPEAELTVVDGVFYGTTTQGGAGKRGGGTVFEVRNDDKERVLHSFTGRPDGLTPAGGVTTLNGSLYGTTAGGGKADSGAVFEVAKDGTERVVYSFENIPDGAIPSGGLTVLGGVLYGTTSGGGNNTNCPYGCGTVFEVRTDGKERVLYSFGGGSDGADPEGTLTVWNGSLYGTTRLGGSGDSGTVFDVTTEGKEHVVYRFTDKFNGTKDGSSPETGVTVFNGALYGTTRYGGTNDRGTIFELQKNGSERILRNLNDADGFFPFAGLTSLGEELYGTALRGGGPDDGGTVFGIKPNGAFRKLYAFTGASGDGKAPNASLVVSSGGLFGTTRRGGVTGHGTIFEVKP